MRIVLALLVSVACKGKDEPATKRVAPTSTRDGAAAAGPHPDFPTPVAAGTDKIFTLEDPDRGPPAPLTVATPNAALQWTTHDFCEAEVWGMVCGPTTNDGPWRVGRSPTVTRAEYRGRAHVVYLGKDDAPDQRVELDAHDRVKAVYRFTPERFSVRNRDGSNGLAGCGSIAYTLDANKRVVEQRCLQWSGEPMHDTNGVAIYREKRDARGFMTEESYFDPSGAPIASTRGFARIVWERDDHGRITKELHVDASGKPAPDEHGCVAIAHTYDRDLVTSDTCVDENGKPVANVAGVAITRYTLDANGCTIKTRRFSTDNKPALEHGRTHGKDEPADALCNTLGTTCVDRSGAAMACSASTPARIDFKRDKLGRELSRKHFDAKGRAANDTSYGAHELRSEWDERDNHVRLSCWDASGRAATCAGMNFHARKSDRDDAGRTTVETYFDANGARTFSVGAYAVRYRYDNYDHLYETRGFDANDQPVSQAGLYVRRNLFDASHKRFGMLALGKNGEPITFTGCFGGMTCPPAWHAMRIVRRRDRSAAQNMFFDQAGKLVLTVDCSKSPCGE